MIFKELKLENFKSHINSVIKFQKGTTIILGENGAGKSSILEGINFALYKKYDVKSLNDLINSNAQKMTVTLNFLVGQQEYQVVRTRRGNKSTAQLYRINENDKKLIVEGDKEVNNNIENLLEMDADLFLNAIYIKQGEIDSLITQKASERKQNISKLLRLEELEISYKNIANIISNYELKKAHIDNLIQDDFQDDKKELQNKQQQLKNNLQNKQDELNTVQKKMKEVKEKISKQNSINIKFQKLNRDKISLDTRISDLSDQISNLEQQFEDLKKYEEIINNFAKPDADINLCEELLDTYVKKNTLSQEYIDTSKELKTYMKQHLQINDIAKIYNIQKIVFEDKYIDDKLLQLQKIIEKDIEETQKELDNVSQQIQHINIDVNVLQKTIFDNKESLQSLSDIESICPICQSVIDEKHKEKLLKDYQNLIAENNDKIERRVQEEQALQKEQGELKNMLRDKNNYLTKITILTSNDNFIKNKKNKIEILDIDILRLDKKIDYLKKELSQYNFESEDDITHILTHLSSKKEQYQEANIMVQQKNNLQKTYDKLTAEYAVKITKLNNTNEKINDLGYNSNLLQEYQGEESRLQEKYYPLIKNISQIENDIKYNQNRIDNIDSKIQQNKEYKNKSKQLNNFISLLKNIRELYSKDGLQKDIRLSFKPKIEYYTQEFFNKFDFDYSTLQLSDDYDIVLIGPSGETNASMISGGEKIAVALALRLGIAQAITINNIETILLDEPTIHLDSLRKQEFVKVIQDISLVPQTIIITHDIDLENAATNIITIEKNQGKSIVV